MLGWALKKGFQGATGLRDAPEGGGDTTQIDAPDTPAPVFAARAIRNALWGQPTTESQPAVTKQNKTERVEPATTATTSIPTDTRSPTKLNSILLTPGTGTSRRKRVSFGRDVKAGNNADASPSSARSGRLRRKTTLQQALENSRPGKPQVEEQEEDDTEDDGEWEDEDVCCGHELTVDLNEPHSESGKYWKAEWSRYREEAKSDIEQLVKYKANARSYAAKKDMEASRLTQKLKEEQSKVVKMEAKIAEMTTKFAVTSKHGTDEDNALMAKDLARQTSLVAEYRERVKSLETRLKEASAESNLNRGINTSPRTEQNILEVSRELRKARTELRQLDRLRDEVKRLKSNLATSRERVAELEVQAAAGQTSESSRTEKLEKQLREVKEESRQKDADIRKLKRDYESLKRDAKSRTAEALQVLQDKNTRIDQLEKKLKDMEAAHASKRPKSLDAVLAENSRITRDLKSDIESLSKPSRYEKARSISRHTRAASVEDMTLDMTQRSLLREKDDIVMDDSRRENAPGAGLLTDWTADIPTFELQSKDNNRQEDARKPDRNPIAEGRSTSSARQAAKRAEQRPLDVNHRVVSDVLSNRVNESTRRRFRRNQPSETNDAFAADRNQIDNGRRISSVRTASLTEDRATMRGAIDQSPRRSRPLSRITRPVSPINEAPVVDLVQDRFSRLGGPPADRSVLGNTSRSRGRKGEVKHQETRRRHGRKLSPDPFVHAESNAANTRFAPPLPPPPLGLGPTAGLLRLQLRARVISRARAISIIIIRITTLQTILHLLPTPISLIIRKHISPIRASRAQRAVHHRGSRRRLRRKHHLRRRPAGVGGTGARAALHLGEESSAQRVRGWWWWCAGGVFRGSAALFVVEADRTASGIRPPGALVRGRGAPLRPLAAADGVRVPARATPTLVSAAVRAGMFGPYQAQKILAGAELRVLIADMVQREWDVPVEEAGQSVPVMDLWIGRHEMLYSRIFNS
ncbi:hypothetical protein CIB48_g5705 [Xylaria polymorpha]|nr:hypothetical protein CIB48_g5705 [Xylaria polymorpha]